MGRRSHLRNLIEYVAASSVLGLLAWTPRPVANRLSRGCAWLLDHAVPRLRRIALRNLKLVRMDTAIADGVFHSVARLLVGFARMPRINASNVGEWIRYEGYEHYEQALTRGKGVLFATAHLGNWELSAYAHALMSSPMHIVVRPLDNPLIDALVSRRRTLSGNRIIEKKDFARAILRALSANEAVGILVDQNAGLDDGVFVDFFGIPACAGTGLAKIAARSGAPVIPGFAVWLESEGRYVLRFYAPVEVTGDPAADTQRIQAKLESVIREYPNQWLWIHRRWKTRPPGEKSLY